MKQKQEEVVDKIMIQLQKDFKEWMEQDYQSKLDNHPFSIYMKKLRGKVKSYATHGVPKKDRVIDFMGCDNSFLKEYIDNLIELYNKENGTSISWSDYKKKWDVYLLIPYPLFDDKNNLHKYVCFSPYNIMVNEKIQEWEYLESVYRTSDKKERDETFNELIEIIKKVLKTKKKIVLNYE
jgi:hypothetical protein